MEKNDEETTLDHDKSHDKNYKEIDTKNYASIRARNVMPFAPNVLQWFDCDPIWLC